MNVLSIVNNGVALLIRAAGDAIVDVTVAAAIPFDPQPGEDYEPSWRIYSGKGFFEKTNVEDYPDTSIQMADKTLVLLQCEHELDMHDFVRVGTQAYHVYGVKPDVVGTTRVLQKLLVRPEQKAGIAWESRDLSEA